jgi:hypothetical protein
MASIRAYEQYNLKLRSQMRKSLVDSLIASENKGAYGDSTYQTMAFNEYYKQQLCHLADCPEGSHLAMWDDQKHFYPDIIQFINDVDPGNFLPTK